MGHRGDSSCRYFKSLSICFITRYSYASINPETWSLSAKFKLSLCKLLVGVWRITESYLEPTLAWALVRMTVPSMSPIVNCSNAGVVTCKTLNSWTSLFKNWLFECVLHLHFNHSKSKENLAETRTTVCANQKAVECPWSCWISWVGRWSGEQKT